MGGTRVFPAVPLAAVLLALCSTVECRPSPGRRVGVGDTAPTFELPRVGSAQPFDTRSLAGRVVVVNFWATWCAPCVEEMPSLERLHRALSSRGLVVLAVAADHGEADVASFVREHGLTLPVLHDRGGRLAARLFGVSGYPDTVTIGRDGRVIHRAVGAAAWDTPEAVAYFGGLLRAPHP
jgi:peroxiredoxin